MALSGKAVKRIMPKGSRMLDWTLVYMPQMRFHVHLGKQSGAVSAAVDEFPMRVECRVLFMTPLVATVRGSVACVELQTLGD